jgi:hypothetical protein
MELGLVRARGLAASPTKVRRTGVVEGVEDEREGGSGDGGTRGPSEAKGRSRTRPRPQIYGIKGEH